MTSTIAKKENLIIGVLLFGVLAVNYLLPFGQLLNLILTILTVLIGVFVIVPGAWQTLYRKTGIHGVAWLLAAAIAIGGIAISYRLGDPQPYYDGLNPYRDYMTAYGWAASIFIGSTLGMAVALGHLGRYRLIRSASVSPAAEIDGGVVAVEGQVEPATTPLSGPVSNRETVWYRRAIEKPTLFRGYREIEQEIVGDPFYVKDGSGRLLVIPDQIDQHAAVEFAESQTADDGERRQREWSYEPKDPVTIVGEASEVSRANYPEPVVLGLEGPVIVARGTVPDLRSWATRRAILGGVISFTVGGISFFVMLLTA